MSVNEEPVASPGFVERNGLWSPLHVEAGAEMIQKVRGEGVEAGRFSFADQPGILRG